MSTPDAIIATDGRSPAITPVLQQAFAYWDAKRGNRRMPARRDIDPTEIKPLLPNLALIDVVPGVSGAQPCDFRHRLIGTDLERHFAGRRTGTLLSEFVPWDPASKAWRKLLTVVQSGKPSFEQVPYVGLHKDFLTMADVALPLSEDDAQVTMLMIVLDFIPRAPRSV